MHFVLVTYRITRHSNIVDCYFVKDGVLVTYRITRHSNLRFAALAFVVVLVTYRITRHSNLKSYGVNAAYRQYGYSISPFKVLYALILTYFFVIFKYFA